MQISESVQLVVLTGLFTLVAALGSQIVGSSRALRAKRIELAFDRKADAYSEFMTSAATFGHDPTQEANYLQFLHSYLGALLITSPEVQAALKGADGVHINAQRLRTARDYIATSEIQQGGWLTSMNRAEEAMRRDLHDLSHQ